MPTRARPCSCLGLSSRRVFGCIAFVLVLLAGCELTPGGCEQFRTDCAPSPSAWCSDAAACIDPARAEWKTCEAACGDLEPCAAELCLVDCREVWLTAVAECYVEHPCDASDARAEEWTCKQPALDDARDCLAMCSDAASGQACVDGLDAATMACEPSPFD